MGLRLRVLSDRLLAFLDANRAGRSLAAPSKTETGTDACGGAIAMTDEPLPKAIQRTFRDLSDAEVADIEKASLLARAGFRGSLGWEDLLRSERVLIVSEAGVGKTHETKAQRDRLWAAGEDASKDPAPKRRIAVDDDDQHHHADLRLNRAHDDVDDCRRQRRLF